MKVIFQFTEKGFFFFLIEVFTIKLILIRRTLDLQYLDKMKFNLLLQTVRGVELLLPN